MASSDMTALKASDPEVMRSFYQRLFPWRFLFQWLNHSPTPTDDFGNREFAFTLQNDAYLRYQSFATADLYGFPFHSLSWELLDTDTMFNLL
jgi:DNA primase small subunit